MEPIREIPQRELRNNVAGILREVAAGERLRVTVRGKPVADIVPVSELPRPTPRSEIEWILKHAPLDPGFADDVDEVLGTIQDL